MEQYIPKSALVAKIERLGKNAWESFKKGNSTEDQYYLRYGVIQDILSLINNLEVKEVDLNFEQELYKAFGQVKDFTLGMRIAKHFFELGLKAQKGEEV